MPAVTPNAPYTMGSFQYFLLYICPNPGNMAERIAATFGLYTLTCAFFDVSAFTVMVFVESTATSFSFSCAFKNVDASTKVMTRNSFLCKKYFLGGLIIWILFKWGSFSGSFSLFSLCEPKWPSALKRRYRPEVK